MSVLFSGRVVDAVDGSPLPGASVFVVERPSVGVSADANGNYDMFDAQAGEHVQVSFVGYDDEVFAVPLGTPIAPIVTRLQGGTLPEVTATGIGAGTALALLATVAGVLALGQDSPRRVPSRRRR